MTPKPHSRWQLDPESPFYDEFTDIHPGQWWITTPTGVIGCSEEEDARTILGLVEQLEAAERKLAGVTSKTALDVVAEKMAAEDRARELKEQLEASLTFADHFLQWCEGVAAEEDSPIHLLVSEARALNPAKRPS